MGADGAYEYARSASANRLQSRPNGAKYQESVMPADAGTPAAQARLERVTPMLAVRDLKRTIEWYTRGLGFQLGDTFGDPPVWCSLRRDDVQLFFNRPPASAFPAEWPGHVPTVGHPPCPQPSASSPTQQIRSLHIFYLHTNDLPGLHAEFVRRGAAPTGMRVTVYGMKEFELRDPDGYWLWFGQPTDEPPTVRE